MSDSYHCSERSTQGLMYITKRKVLNFEMVQRNPVLGKCNMTIDLLLSIVSGWFLDYLVEWSSCDLVKILHCEIKFLCHYPTFSHLIASCIAVVNRLDMTNCSATSQLNG